MYPAATQLGDRDAGVSCGRACAHSEAPTEAPTEALDFFRDQKVDQVRFLGGSQLALNHVLAGFIWIGDPMPEVWVWVAQAVPRVQCDRDLSCATNDTDLRMLLLDIRELVFRRWCTPSCRRHCPVCSVLRAHIRQSPAGLELWN